MEKDFPIAPLVAAKRALDITQKQLGKEKAAWAAIRNTLHDATATRLDEQVAQLFDKDLSPYFGQLQRPDIRAIHQSLQQLYQQGPGSAGSKGENQAAAAGSEYLTASHIRNSILNAAWHGCRCKYDRPAIIHLLPNGNYTLLSLSYL